MIDWPILSLVTFLPLVGVVFLLLVRGDPDIVARNSRYVALWASLTTFVVSLLLWYHFDNSAVCFQYVERHPWMPSFGIDYHMGVDGISVFFVILSTFLTPWCAAGMAAIARGGEQVQV